MKKLLFLGLAALTWYLAGLYRLPSLMALALLELVLAAVMLLVSRYFRSKLCCSFQKAQGVCIKSGKQPVYLTVENRGRLPIGRIRLRLAVRYQGEKKAAKISLWTGAAGRSKVQVPVTVQAPYCGLAEILLERAEVWDYFTLFRASRREHQQMELAVLPSGYRLQIPLPEGGGETGWSPWQEQLPAMGRDYGEIRQLREYVPGDSSRQVHWNQSARTGTLLVKEYEQEQNARFHLFLNPQAPVPLTMDRADAFYELASGLVLGLLEESAGVLVCWPDGKGGLRELEVTEESGWEQLMIALYREQAAKGEGDKTGAETKNPPDADFCLGTDLRLFFQGEECLSLEPEHWESQLKKLEQSIEKRRLP